MQTDFMRGITSAQSSYELYGSISQLEMNIQSLQGAGIDFDGRLMTADYRDGYLGFIKHARLNKYENT